MQQELTTEDKNFFFEYSGSLVQYMNGVSDYVKYLLMCREYGIEPEPMGQGMRKFCRYLDKMTNSNGLETIDSIACFSFIDAKQNHRYKKKYKKKRK